MPSGPERRINEAFQRRRNLRDRLRRSGDLAEDFTNLEAINQGTQDVVSGIRAQQRKKRQTVMISAS